jgi:hypothetical protein
MSDAVSEPQTLAWEAALNRYGAAFPAEDLPFLLAVLPQDWPLAIRMLDGAVAAGSPLGWWAIMDAMGIGQPPDGVCL